MARRPCTSVLAACRSASRRCASCLDAALYPDLFHWHGIAHIGTALRNVLGVPCALPHVPGHKSQLEATLSSFLHTRVIVLLLLLHNGHVEMMCLLCLSLTDRVCGCAPCRRRCAPSAKRWPRQTSALSCCQVRCYKSEAHLVTSSYPASGWLLSACDIDALLPETVSTQPASPLETLRFTAEAYLPVSAAALQ